MSVLLVDGDNLLTIGFYGVKNQFYKGQHIGGIYHFLNTLRKSFETYNLGKIVVFWDGEEGSRSRKLIYPYYKEDRKNKTRSEEEINSYNYQRSRIQQYLEELYVRQGEYKYCETDDNIAYYVQNSPNENKIIYSSDGDLTQLVSTNTKLFNPSHQKLYSNNDIILYEHQEVLIENVKMIKMMCGDKSDSISGIKGLGVKTFLSLFPELKTTPLDVDYIKEKGNLLFEQNNKSKTITNLLTGVTKHGVLGDEFFDVNNRIVSLDVPFLTDEAREEINNLINESLDSEGRSYKNTMKMMVQDGIFNVLPKSEDAWINFLNPFLRLTRKEKNKKLTRTIKINNHE
jgi:5'-3' exonuclease